MLAAIHMAWVFYMPWFHIMFLLPMVLLQFFIHVWCDMKMLYFMFKEEGERKRRRRDEEEFFTDLFKTFMRFYALSIIFYLCLMRLLFDHSWFILALFGLSQVPQLVINVIQRNRRAPGLAFTIISIVQHLFAPLYLRGLSFNWVKAEPHTHLVVAVVAV